MQLEVILKVWMMCFLNMRWTDRQGIAFARHPPARHNSSGVARLLPTLDFKEQAMAADRNIPTIAILDQSALGEVYMKSIGCNLMDLQLCCILARIPR
mmetsp:Transcript_28830/g.59084  ORF Transcript_28830/g.59084 Transcript_28830/m.59084 type:complete len:98 (+) Transcript_28830:671-964(+)